MKRVLMISAAICLSLFAFSQKQLPKKQTKGLEVSVDEFNGGVKYRSKTTGLTIISKKDGCEFTWTLNCYDLTPISFSKVQILANGKVEDIPFSQDDYREYTETARVPQKPFSGGRMAVTWINQERFIAEIKIDASKHLDLLDRIIEGKQDAKIRFSGNKEANGEYNKKERAEMRTIVNAYRLLTSE